MYWKQVSLMKTGQEMHIFNGNSHPVLTHNNKVQNASENQMDNHKCQTMTLTFTTYEIPMNVITTIFYILITV